MFLSEFLSAEKIKLLLLSGISALVKMLVGYITIKIFAVFIGPEGLALTGQVSNLIALLTAVTALGLNTGIVKYVAQYRSDTPKLKSVISTGFKVILYSSIFSALLLLLFSSTLTTKIFYSYKYYGVIISLSFSLPLILLNGFLVSVLNGHKLVNELVLINIVSGLISVLMAILLVWFWGMQGALFSLILSSSISVLSTSSVIKDELWFKSDYFFSEFDLGVFKDFLRFALMSIISALLVPLTQFYVRNLITEKLSLAEAGEWEALNRMSNTYLSIISSIFAVYYLPRLSEIKKKSELLSEIFSIVLLILPLVLIMQVSIFFLRKQVVEILFSEKFSRIESLIGIQLLGDFLRVSSWIVGYVLIARVYTKSYILSELVSFFIYISLATVLLTQLGVEGVVLAYSIDSLLHFTLLCSILFILFRKKCN